MSEYCPSGFTPVNAAPVGAECLKLKTGMEKAASRLETRRYAAMKGATTEWTKMEGMTYSKKHNELYMAMSSIQKSMENNKKYGLADDQYDIGGWNKIKTKFNQCGCIYRMPLDPSTNLYTEIKSFVCGQFGSDNGGSAT